MDKSIIERAVKAALKIRENAHAPYSGFKVGAVIITEEGELFSGVNIENSSFGATVCAERSALFSAVSAGSKKLYGVVIVSELNGRAVFPCGICRQVLADFNSDMKVILVNAKSGLIEKELSLKDIFPDQFKF